MFDILPKIKLCTEHYLLKEIDFIYFKSLHNFQKQALSILNIDEDKILNSDLNRHIQATELIVVDHPWYHKGFILDQVQFLPTWIIQWLRDVYLKHGKRFDINDKIYIDRSGGAKHCQFINETEINENPNAD